MGKKMVTKTKVKEGGSVERKVQSRSCENFKILNVRFKKCLRKKPKLNSNCRKQKRFASEKGVQMF